MAPSKTVSSTIRGE